VVPLIKIVAAPRLFHEGAATPAVGVAGSGVLQWITLVGFGLQLIAALLPMVDFTVNLVVLLTNLLLPVAVIWLCRPELRALKQERKAARAVRMYPVPQDPFVLADPTQELAR
jgi:Ca2+/Na+ antiporter